MVGFCGLWVLSGGDRFRVFSRNNNFYSVLESSVYRDELKFGVDGFVTSVLCSAFKFTSLVGVESSD